MFSPQLSARNRNVLIIGGSKGIGKSLVSLYNGCGYKVYSTYNQTKPELSASSGVHFIKTDLLDKNSINEIAQSVKNTKFDIIIYNAGKFGYKSNRGPNLNRQDWIESFVVNAIAPIELAYALQSNFIDSEGKYVVISSRRGSNTINIRDQYTGRYSYRSSKAAVNSSLVALAMDFKKEDITVLMLHPGRVATKMTKYAGMKAAESARLIKNTIDQKSFADTGKFVDVQTNEDLPW